MRLTGAHPGARACSVPHATGAGASRAVEEKEARWQSRTGEAGAAGVGFRNEIVTGRGGKQILLDDPSGNPIELFQPNPA